MGDAEALRQELQTTREPKFIANGRFWLASARTWVPAAVVHAVEVVRVPVPRIEVLLHGEYRDGPAPRGMDRFRVEITGGTCKVDTGTVLEGPPRGTRTSQPAPEGEHCVTIG